MRRAAWVVLTAITASITVLAQYAPRDYPQWRGQRRDGSGSAFVEPDRWPAALTRRWSVEVGEGYATPLVIGDAVYTFTRREGQEVLRALDSATGTERWRTRYAAPYTPAAAAAAHGAGPKATPAFAEGRIVTLGISGIVSAFDAASGKLLWQSKAPDEPPFFSAASSPLIDAGTVFAHSGNYDPLTAFDAATGAVKWRAGAGGFFAAPLSVDLEGAHQIVTVTQKNVLAVSPVDGRELWQVPWPGESGGPMPVLDAGLIIVSGLNAGVAAFRPALVEGKWTASKVWETKEVSMYLSNPVVIDGTLYGLSHRSSGQFFALDASSGRTLWLSEPRQATNTAVVKAGRLLFLLNDDGELIVAGSNREKFDPIRRYSVADTATWAQPAIVGNRIFVKDVSSLTMWTVD
jgi:outer membrane protein assembly factor BamB